MIVNYCERKGKAAEHLRFKRRILLRLQGGGGNKICRVKNKENLIRWGAGKERVKRRNESSHFTKAVRHGVMGRRRQ